MTLFPVGSHFNLRVEALVFTMELLVHADEVPLGHDSQGQHVAIDSCCIVLLIAQDVRVFTVKRTFLAFLGS